MTRCDLVSEYSKQVHSDILASIKHEGGSKWRFIIEQSMHALLRADDALEHRTRDDLMRRLRPHMIKRKR